MDLMSKLKEASARNKQVLAKGGTSSKVTFLTVKEGESKIIRMLPMGIGEDLSYPFKEYKMHSLKIKDGFRTFVCADDPAAAESPPCPLCELQKALWYKAADLEEDGEPDTLKLAAAMKKQAVNLRSKDRIAVNVIDKDAADDKKFCILDMSRTTFNMVMGLIESDGYGVITDIAEGSDLTITRSGTGIDTTYMVLPRKNNEIVIPEDWHKHTVNLNTLRQYDAATINYLTDTIGSGKEIYEIESKDIPFTKRNTTYTAKTTEEPAEEPAEEAPAPVATTPAPAPVTTPAPVPTPAPVIEPPKPEVVEPAKTEPAPAPAPVAAATPAPVETPAAAPAASDLAKTVQAQVQATLEKLRAAKNV